jgi:cell division septum initiation protein DivIVA
MNNSEEINKILEENDKLKNKIKELEENLQIYTNSERHIKYYQNNKEKVKERAKNYMEKIKLENPEKIKEWRHNAYINRKNKLKNNLQSDDI